MNNEQWLHLLQKLLFFVKVHVSSDQLNNTDTTFDLNKVLLNVEH